MNLFLFLSNLTILATGYLTKDLSAKNFVFIGSVLTSLGLFLSAFVTTFAQLIFTFPVMIGIGLGLLNPAAFVAVLSCFTCHRTYAVSIVFAALGFGQTVMPMAVKQILNDFGLQEGLIMLSLLSTIGIVGANFLVPITWRPCRRASLVNNMEQQPLLPRKEERFSTFKDIVRGADLDLLFNFRYITIIMGLSIVYACSMNLNIVFPVYLVSEILLVAHELWLELCIVF
jgi:MFS family permease